MSAAGHSAFVRGDDGNLHMRSFDAAGDATAASFERELPEPGQVRVVMGRQGGKIRHTVFARKLGLTTRQVRHAFNEGALPGAVAHSDRIIVVPVHLLRLAEAYGLKQVRRMAKAGLL